MSTTLLRTQTLRHVVARQFMRPAARRTYAEQTAHARAADPSTPTKNNLPLIGVGCVMAAVPFYYFYHSNRSPGEGKKDMAEARKRGGGPSSEYRDVRDSPIKTLEDKRRRDEGK